MDKQKPSPMSEAILWKLYRRLLGEQLFEDRLRASGGPKRTMHNGFGIAAALTENLIEGDTTGLAPGDLSTRYLCGVPLDQIHAASLVKRGRLKSNGWWLDADADHGLLPCSGEEQASLALGSALAARLHHTESMTVLFDQTVPRSVDRAGLDSPWARAAHMAVTLQLPMLFISAGAAARQPGPKKQPPSLPSIPVDRSDALALYRVIYESAARARSGGGPTWIECCAWPLAENESALSKMEKALRERHLFDRREQRHLQQTLMKEFTRAGWPLPARAF